MCCFNCTSSFEDTQLLDGYCPSSYILFMTGLQLLLQSTCDIAEPCYKTAADSVTIDDELIFDYIVVGSGVAGPVVSSRLSENPNWQILQIEAGPEEPTISSIPAYSAVAVGTSVDWNFTTVPQENACLRSGGICSWPRGKMVGGSGAMNGMMYVRGHPSIYNQWSTDGNSGWAFDEVLPYFKKSEMNLNPDEVEPGYHGYRGPMVIQKFPSLPVLTDSLLLAGEQIGYRSGADLNGANMTGISVAQMSVYEGIRGNPSRMYLRAAAASRDNLKSIINAHVTKVLIHPKNLTAYGVEYINSAGERRTVLARKEVILSAGTIGSPHLLFLSGVGPRADLEAVGIPVLLDLPGVGQNLRNHVSVAVNFFTNDTYQAQLTNDTIEEFLNNRTGPLASTGLTQTTGFFLSSNAKDGVPDLQVFFDAYVPRCSRTGSPDECPNGEIQEDCGTVRVAARPTSVLPLSQGFLKLNSSDPLAHPYIDPQYFSVDSDVDVLVDGIKTIIRMTQTPALQEWGFQLDTTPEEGCENLTFGTDDYWKCVIRTHTLPENHQAGTCKMGPADDPLAVVDAKLRVRGIRGLRIADASVFPYPPNSNSQAGIVMVAEKLADFVKKSCNEDFQENPIPVVPFSFACE